MQPSESPLSEPRRESTTTNNSDNYNLNSSILAVESNIGRIIDNSPVSPARRSSHPSKSIHRPSRVEIALEEEYAQRPQQQQKKQEQQKSYEEKHADSTQQLHRRCNCWACIISILSYFDGNMPALNEFLARKRLYTLDYFNCVLRGVGQVVFMDNPVSGAFILFGLFWGNWWQALCGITAVFSGTLAGILFGLPEGPRRSGLFGYNALLTGIALALFQPQHYRALVLATIFGGMSTIINVALGNVLVSILKIPPFTLAFNITTYIFVLATFQSQYLPLNTSIIAPAQKFLQSSDSTSFDINAIDYLQAWWGIWRGVGQVFFSDNRFTCLMIVVGMAVSSRTSAVMAVVGCVAGGIMALILGVSLSDMYDGLWSYNSCLSAIAIGGMFYVPSVRVFGFAVVNAMTTTILEATWKTIIYPYGLTALTYPFCFSSIIFLLVHKSVASVHAMDMQHVTTPEGNLKYFRKMQSEKQQQELQQRQLNEPPPLKQHGEDNL